MSRVPVISDATHRVLSLAGEVPPPTLASVQRWPKGAGRLRDGGDGGEAVRRVRGDVVAGGRAALPEGARSAS